MNLEDIAKKAGVSRSTVSRVINQDRYVRQETRDRVMSIVEVENFQPNVAARTLVTRRSEIIGVVIPTQADENIFFTDNSYFPMLLAGIGEGTRERDYGLLLWLGELTDPAKKWTQKISNRHLMDGLVVASLAYDHPLLPRILELRLPLVMIDRPLHYEDQISYVTVDNIAAAEQIVNHLFSVGRRRIAHITGHLEIGDGRDRLEGYKSALTKLGLPVEPNLIYHGKFNRAAGYEGMKHLMQHKPDAIFAAGDTIAIGVLHAAKELGIQIPQEVSLVGFDDIDVAQQAAPHLTTMRQPVQQKGAAAAALLIDLIEGHLQGPQHIVLPTQLVIRQSCGANPAAL